MRANLGMFFTGAALLLCGTGMAQAAEPASAAAGDLGVSIESCVSKDRIRIGRDEPRAALDATDHAHIRNEMMRRYPIVAGDGFPVSRIILWQKTRRSALFVTVLDHPSKPGLSCFTATFTAERFDDFTRLRDKYFVDD